MNINDKTAETSGMQPAAKAPQRLQYIDAMRGTAMLLIVFGHLVWSYHASIDEWASDIYTTGEMASIRSFTNFIQLPMFFLVSGFVLSRNPLTYKSLRGGVFLLRKFRQLIVPAVVFGGVWAVYKAVPFGHLVGDVWKGGYWFTITLFQFMVLITAVEWLCAWRRWSPQSARYALVLCVTALALYALSISSVRNMVPYHDAIQMKHLNYFVPFAIGRLLRIHLDTLTRWRYRGAATAATVLVFFAFFVNEYIGIGIPTLSGALYHVRYLLYFVSAAIVVFLVFYRNRAYFERGGTIVRALTLIGRRTMDIYMLHYFFLPDDLSPVGRYFSEHPSVVVEAVTAAAVTVVVVAAAMAVGAALRTSDILARWLLGGK